MKNYSLDDIKKIIEGCNNVEEARNLKAMICRFPKTFTLKVFRQALSEVNKKIETYNNLN
jgi:DNA-binding transcriptional MerR regulator